MPTQVKICGLTTLADARYCAGAGADFLGFIFHPSSPRYVEPATVREIAEWLHGPEIVGVFVDQSADDVNAMADAAGLTMVQLHGDETPATCAAITRPVIKALRVSADDTADALAARMRSFGDGVELFLLDTFATSAPGGTGESFDWDVAEPLAAEFPLLLSGGVRRENVRMAIERVRPFGVDLSSGVESSPGQKDFDLLADFFDVFDELRDVHPAFSRS